MPVRPRRQNTQTISWFNDLYKRRLLDLEPPYQRRSVWNQAYKDAFIDTVLQQFPAPAIFLFEEISPEGISKYHVVDGKQRLTAVFEFIAGAFPVSEESELNQLRGKYFEQLPSDEKTAFWTYEFSIEYLPTSEEALINEIFRRINKNTAKLTPQELRHARFSGPFITAAEDLAETMKVALPENFPRIESQSRKQMKDVELVANLLLLLEGMVRGDAEEELGEIRGYSQDDLDNAFSERETAWEYTQSTSARFDEVLQFLGPLAKKPDSQPLFKTRLRNQADFYSLFAALAYLLKDASFKERSKEVLAAKLSEFISKVEDPTTREADPAAQEYFVAARSNSNDSGPRRTRVRLIRDLLSGESA